MKICSIHIKAYKQFQDTYLDFTDPKTGEPASKICFIGKNGTGKTTILKIINTFLNYDKLIEIDNNNKNTPLLLLLKVKIEDKFYFILSKNEVINFGRTQYFYHNNHQVVEFFENIKELKHIDWEKISNFALTGQEYVSLKLPKDFDKSEMYRLRQKIKKDLIIYSPSESLNNNLLNLSDVPTTSVNDALKLFNDFPIYHEISDQNIQQFWTLLIYLIKKREEQQQVFENQSENLSKTKRELLEEFEKTNPKILDKIATLWNKILDKAGLEFDVESASNPIQLTDNLKAYIRLKGTKENIPYSELSTGIRNFIFRVGHIFSLYFNREIANGFLLLDEPENSLFPDFLFELIESYESIVVDKNGNNNTQIFMTTHNPIIAAQFEPHERIILEWENNGTVLAQKGKTPVGDDPNDILKNDFGLESLMGKKGVQMWNEYLSLKQSLRRETKNEEKLKLIEKITSIGTAYNFE